MSVSLVLPLKTPDLTLKGGGFFSLLLLLFLFLRLFFFVVNHTWNLPGV